MPTTLRRTTLAAALLFACGTLHAAPQWRVVLHGPSTQMHAPGLPASPASYGFTLRGPDLGPDGTFDTVITRGDGRDGRWIEHDGIAVPLAELETTGATGPNRNGADDGHVFLEWISGADAGAPGQRVFIAAAGEPGVSPNNTREAVWRSEGTGLVEIARYGRDDILGPGIGSGWSFASNVPFANATSAADGRIVLHASVRPAGENPRGAVIQHIDSGNRACAIVFSNAQAHRPNIFASDVFESLAQPALSTDARVFARGTARTEPPGGGYRIGLWQLCDGAPVARVLTVETNALGPGIDAHPAANFTALHERIAPADGGFFFPGSGREAADAGSPGFNGVFFHADGGNGPVVLTGDAGAFGPGIAGRVFANANVLYRVSAAGRFAVIDSTVRTPPATSTQQGLWRLEPGQTAVPLALAGEDGALAPAPGLRWTSFTAAAVFANGDVVALARTSDNRAGVWRLRAGHAPVALLRIGDSVAVPTPGGGTAQAAVTNIALPGSAGEEDHAGDDHWASASGHVLLDVDLAGHTANPVFVRGLATDPDHLFGSSFE